MIKEVKGVSFPFRIGGRGGVSMSGRSSSGLQQKLKENIMSIVGTMELERVMNPEYGIESLDIFFDDLNESTGAMAKFKIMEKVRILEPRVNVLDVLFKEIVLDSGQTGYTADIMFEEIDSGEVSTVSVLY